MGTSCGNCCFEEKRKNKNNAMKGKTKNIINNTSLLLNNYKKNKNKNKSLVKNKKNKKNENDLNDLTTEISIVNNNVKYGEKVKNIYEIKNKKKKINIINEKVNEVKDNKKSNKISFMKGEKIAEDRFGEIFTGFSIKNGKNFIIKIYNKIADIQKNKIIQNLDALYKLNHNNILKVLPILEENIFDENGDLSIAYEYINLENIDENINKYGIWNETLLQKLLKQLLEGIKYLHENNIYHKNLNASNIYLDSNGTIKISDYLIDNIILGDAITIYNNILKSDKIEYYIPPFFIKAIKEYNSNNSNNDKNDIFDDWKSYDLWLLGCLIIELFSKQKPWSYYKFENISKFLEFLGKTNEIPNIPRKLSSQCQDLIKILLNYSETKKPNIYDIIFNLDFFKLDTNDFTYLTNVESKKSSNDKNKCKSPEYSKLHSSNEKLVNILGSGNNAYYTVSNSEEEKTSSLNNINIMNSYIKLNNKLNMSIYNKYNSQMSSMSEVKEVET